MAVYDPFVELLDGTPIFSDGVAVTTEGVFPLVVLLPSVRGSNSGTDTTGASVTATLPTHAAGDVLVVVFGYSSDEGTWATPSGWTAGPTSLGASLFWLDATSASETDPTSTRVGNNRAGWVTYAIQDVGGTISVVDGGTNDEASTSNPNPPSVSVTDGPQNVMSLAFDVNFDGRRTVSGGPSGYSLDETFSSGGGAAGVTGGGASLAIAGTSTVDPGTFTISDVSEADTITFLIRGGTPVTVEVTGDVEAAAEASGSLTQIHTVDAASQAAVSTSAAPIQVHTVDVTVSAAVTTTAALTLSSITEVTGATQAAVTTTGVSTQTHTVNAAAEVAVTTTAIPVQIHVIDAAAQAAVDTDASITQVQVVTGAAESAVTVTAQATQIHTIDASAQAATQTVGAVTVIAPGVNEVTGAAQAATQTVGVLTQTHTVNAAAQAAVETSGAVLVSGALFGAAVSVASASGSPVAAGVDVFSGWGIPAGVP